MAMLDVRRSWPSTVLRCLRERLRNLSTSPCAVNESCTEPAVLVSAGQIAFPRVAPVTSAFRFVERYEITHGQIPVRTVEVTTLLVVLATGRTEIFLDAFGGHGSVSQSSALRLARILAARARA